MTVPATLQAYAKRIRDSLRVHPGALEPALAPHFQRLIEELLPFLDAIPPLSVSPEFNQPGVGRPDIALK